MTKNELLDAVWPGTFVSDAVLTHCMAEVRQALQDDAQKPRLLRTMPKIGYAFAAEVHSCFEASAATPGGMPWAAESVEWAAAVSGDVERGRRALEESMARSQTSYVPSSGIACLHLGLGGDDAIFEWLARSVEERDALMPWLRFMPAFDRVRPDPRFQTLLARIGLG